MGSIPYLPIGFVVYYEAISNQGGTVVVWSLFLHGNKGTYFFMLFLLATYLSIDASGKLSSSKAARKLVLWVAGLVVPISLTMEGSGAIISIAVKVALLLKNMGG